MTLFLVKVTEDNGVRLQTTWEITRLQNLIKYGTGTLKAERKQTKIMIISVLYYTAQIIQRHKALCEVFSGYFSRILNINLKPTSDVPVGKPEARLEMKQLMFCW